MCFLLTLWALRLSSVCTTYHRTEACKSQTKTNKINQSWLFEGYNVIMKCNQSKFDGWVPNNKVFSVSMNWWGALFSYSLPKVKLQVLGFVSHCGRVKKQCRKVQNNQVTSCEREFSLATFHQRRNVVKNVVKNSCWSSAAWPCSFFQIHFSAFFFFNLKCWMIGWDLTNPEALSSFNMS